MENKVLATINGKEITENDMQEAMSKFPAQNQAQFATENGKKQLLDQMVAFELIYNDAVEKGLQDTEEFKKQLEKTKKDLLIQIGINNIISTISVTDEETKDFYANNPAMFKAGETAKAKHILVDTEEEAKNIAKEIENGKSFEDAAKEYSKCPSNASGGDLGSFGRGQMVPEFDAVVFTTEIGKVSEPVKTQFGYHLIKVEERTEPKAKAFEEVKEMIKNWLVQEKQQTHYLEVIDGLKKKYPVEIK